MAYDLDEYDKPRVPLERAEPLFIEMLRQIQEEGSSEASFFNAKIKGTDITLSFAASGLHKIQGVIRASEHLGTEELRRLVREGWAHPEDEIPGFSAPSRLWEGITSQAERRHITEEVLSILMDRCGIPGEKRIFFQLCLYGAHSDKRPETQP